MPSSCLYVYILENPAVAYITDLEKQWCLAGNHK